MSLNASARSMCELETERLRLRPLAEADREALSGIYADPEVARGLITQAPTLGEFERPFEQMLRLASTLGMWAILSRRDGRLIGRCGFYPFSEPPAEIPELAYLLSSDSWGRGLATEAARRCIEHAFSEREWREVVAMVRLGNTASVRVLAKLGMQPLRRIEVRGVAADLFRLDVATWRRRRGA